MDNIKGKPARTFQDLIVWQKAHQFVLGVYRFTKNFPKEEMYGLTSQLRRSAVSIPANIADTPFLIIIGTRRSRETP